jgi:hypothetical protein
MSRSRHAWQRTGVLTTRSQAKLNLEATFMGQHRIEQRNLNQVKVESAK